METLHALPKMGKHEFYLVCDDLLEVSDNPFRHLLNASSMGANFLGHGPPRKSPLLKWAFSWFMCAEQVSPALRLLARDVDQPLNAERICTHPKRVAPYGFFEWHGDPSAGRKLLEIRFQFCFVVTTQ